MMVEIDPGAIRERKADSKGRIAIGPEYADQTVTVAIVKVEESSD